MAFDPNDPRVKEFLREEEKAQAKKAPKKQPKAKEAEPLDSLTEPESAPKPATNSRRRPFQKTRANVPLSKEEVRAIRKGRRKLRRELRRRGIRTKREFELTAGTLGLYWDKNRARIAWFRRHWLGTLLGALAAMLGVMVLLSLITQVRGYFTINLSRGMFREGFSLSDRAGFEYPTTQLLAVPAEGVPCISINQIPTDVDEIDGEHNQSYIAYTFYIRNEGESAVSYTWRLALTAESKNASDAVWCMLIEDGVPRVYAKAGADGAPQALPAKGDSSRGYIRIPVLTELKSGTDQLELIKTRGDVNYYRVVPETFVSDTTLADGSCDIVQPMEVHKYTVVLWVEGDDPECTDEMIGAYLGASMQFMLTGENYESEEHDGLVGKLRDVWDNLRFWDQK